MRSHRYVVCGLAAMLMAGIIRPVAAQDTRFTPHHVAKLRLVTATAIAPGGGHVAYLLSVPRQLPKEKDGPAWSELHVVDTKGTSTPFVTGQVNVEAIAWTPDGTHISFLTKREGDAAKSLYVIPLRGGESRKVLSHSTDIQAYSWSPDGKQVAFLATEPLPKERKAQQEQGFSQEIYEEDVPFVRVWVAGVGDPAGPVRMLKLTGSASELHWSPAGDALAVALAPTPLVDDGLMFRQVNVVDLKSGTATSLKNVGKLGQVAWSPDGKKVAVISGRDLHDPMQGRLFVRPVDGTTWLDALPNFLGHVESIAWKDADTILYTAATGVWTTVGSVKIGVAADGKLTAREQRTLVPPGGAIVSHLVAARDGRTAAYIGHSPKHPPEIFVQGPGDETPRRLTDSNPWLRLMQFAEQEVVDYRARDGLKLEGILVRPLGEKKGQRYPLVLTVHGGPEAHISNGWVTLYHSLGQVGAARGFAVFYPNYRGSTGRGVDFSMLGQGAAAGKEFDDLVDGVDHLIKGGLVDAQKVGVTGGSYGGYATAWCSTYYSHRFAAGVMFVGISDSISKSGTTDIPEEMFLVHHRKRLWDDWDYFLKSSPIYHTEKAKTPLLILHGKVDPRVHPSQSLEMYRNLKIRGQAPVRLVFYPGEGHGNRRAASRLDYNLRLLQWMEHYLKGPGGAPPRYELDYGLEGATKTGAVGNSWRRSPARQESEATTTATIHWLGGKCPCCIGW
ncbi:MAG: S9 family peptidase [Gemmataceae bacterium]|nr:S9 family peptidase [Gemmataceae bacterium]